MADISKITLPNNNSYTIKDDSAVANITRNGTTFTATRRNGTTFTFTQQDSDTTYSAGSGLSLSGTTFNHSNNVTAATAGTSSATSSTNGVIAIPYVTYDSQGHITNSGTHNHTLTGYPEAYLTWGGKDFSASYAPIDAAMIDTLGANRFAFLKAAGITIEYSINGGSSWSDYGATDVQKTGVFSSGYYCYLGKHTTIGSCTTNDQLRITIATGAAGIYTVLNKIAIYMSTSGSTVQVLIEKALESTPTVYSVHKDWTNISGWSGWNILNISGLTTFGNSPAAQYGRIRFTFRQTAVNTNCTSASISKILGFGGVGWIVPSTMAATGHLYSYDASQNATFPAKVTATEFNGTATNANKVNNHTVESDVPANAKFTDTTYTANTGIKLSGTVFQHTNSITAGTVGTSSATNGTTVEIPYVTYDAQGHITASGVHNHTLGDAAEHDVDFAIDENSAESVNLITTQAVMELFNSQEEISIGTTTPTADNFKLWIQI